MQRSDVQQYYLDVRHLTHALANLSPSRIMWSSQWRAESTEMASGAYHRFFETFVLQPYTPDYCPIPI